MSLTRKLLRSMGIDDEKIDQIIEAHTETVDALKSERDKYREEAEKLPKVQKELEDMQKLTVDGESIEAKYNTLMQDFEKYKADTEAKESKAAKEKAFRAALKKVGVVDKRVDAIVKVTNLDNIKLNKDGNITDAEAFEKNLATEWSDFIVTQGEQKAAPETPPTNAGSAEPKRDHRAAKIAAEYHRKLYGGSGSPANEAASQAAGNTSNNAK